MKSLFIFITSYVYLCACLSNVHGLQCNGTHEEIRCVQKCPPEKTCLNKNVLYNCEHRNENCTLKCVCEYGYYRGVGRACVTNEICVKQESKREDAFLTSEVRMCGVNEEYKTCTCPPDTCVSLVAKLKCGPCKPGCACRAGYLRLNEEAPCRLMRECPQLPKVTRL